MSLKTILIPKIFIIHEFFETENELDGFNFFKDFERKK